MPWSGTSAKTQISSIASSSDLLWVCGALGGESTSEEPSRRYLARPSAADPQLLVPLRPRRVAAAALHRVHDARSWRQRLIGLAGQGLALAGGLRLTGGDTVDLAPFPLIEHLSLVLGEPDLIPAISIGPPRRNRKPVVQLVRTDGIVVGFAKVAWSPFTRSLIANEARWLAAVDGHLPRGLRAPVVLAHEQRSYAQGPIDVVVTSPVPTPLRSFRDGPLPVPLLAELARSLGTRRCPVAESGLIDQWRTLIGEVVDLDRLLERIGDVDLELGLWHGDLTPWNTATTRGPMTSVWELNRNPMQPYSAKSTAYTSTFFLAAWQLLATLPRNRRQQRHIKETPARSRGFVLDQMWRST